MSTLGSVAIRKSESEAVLRGLAAGVTPTTGLHHIAVGRAAEIRGFMGELDAVAQGGAGFKIVSGGYGTGKTFLMNLVGYLAMKAGFLVCRADLSADRAFHGSGRGVALYRALMDGMSTRTEPSGGGLRRVLERWVAASAGAEGGLEAALTRMSRELGNMEGGHDFASVLSAFARGHEAGGAGPQETALRWLRGEPMPKREAMGIGAAGILTDSEWYGRMRLWAALARTTGYSGLLVLLDEGDMLYRISHAPTRARNHEAILGILNDTLQGRSRGLYVLLSATPDFVSDRRRGLASCEPLRTRIMPNPGVKGSSRDLTQPVMDLEPLVPEEMAVLLQRVSEIHALHHGVSPLLDAAQCTAVAEGFLGRPGARGFGTVRELLRGFVGGLNALLSNPGMNPRDILSDMGGGPSIPGTGGDPFAGFSLHKP